MTPTIRAALTFAALLPSAVTAQGVVAPRARHAPDTLSPPSLAAPSATTSDSTAAQETKPKAWYERISLRGYAQLRYNRLLETNPDLVCQQCDRSIGNNGGIFLRRARLIFSGDVHERVSIYIQPDYATDAAGQQHYLQIRDAYFDLYLDAKKTHRLRIGQSKVPFGFENLQSSSNRLALDRNDALNSAVPNERDMGVVYYWATETARRRFRILTDSGLKGTGDYGILGVALMNGQTANRPEANNSLHRVLRLSYPFRLPNGQFVELGVAGYDGAFVPPDRSAGVQSVTEYTDRRAAVSLTWYAQPFGVEGEYNWGRGPAFEPTTRSIEERSLRGGFVQTMYRHRRGGQVIQPFVRLQQYSGGKKLEKDARYHEVHELEAGIEWLPIPAFELTAQYTIANRRSEDAATIGNRQKGRFLRLQAQVNY